MLSSCRGGHDATRLHPGEPLGAFRHFRRVFDRRIDTSRPEELVKRWQGPAGLCSPGFRMLRSRYCCGASGRLHGRSSFRDLSGNETHFPRELAEHALAHIVGDKAEQAYRRSDALDLRRELMDVWARYCERGAKVLSFKRPVPALA
jgi:hypothetical protein